MQDRFFDHAIGHERRERMDSRDTDIRVGAGNVSAERGASLREGKIARPSAMARRMLAWGIAGSHSLPGSTARWCSLDAHAMGLFQTSGAYQALGAALIGISTHLGPKSPPTLGRTQCYTNLGVLRMAFGEPRQFYASLLCVSAACSGRLCHPAGAWVSTYWSICAARSKTGISSIVCSMSTCDMPE